MLPVHRGSPIAGHTTRYTSSSLYIQVSLNPYSRRIATRSPKQVRSDGML